MDKTSYNFKPNIQTITVDDNGTILSTDNTIFTWVQGTSIFDAHPFFEILHAYLPSPDTSEDTHFSFPCIHLEDQVNAEEKICDVAFNFEKKPSTIYIYDFTLKYTDINALVQRRNESILKARELELEKEFLLKKEEFKNSFISNINHEMRTPLTSIVGFVEILEKTNLSYEQEELARIIKRESDHLNEIIDDMVDIAKIESGQLAINYEHFSLHKFIQGFKETYSKLSESKVVKFDLVLEESVQNYVIGDKKRLFQIINNLLNNAFKFTDDGHVLLKVSKNYQRGNWTHINFTVEDTGIGIHKEDIPFVFDRFTRFHRDKPISGTGLGLAITKSLITTLGGDIKVESEVDKGTKFSLNIPFKLEITKETKGKQKVKKYTLPETKTKFRVLVVEDEEVTQFLMVKVLISTGRFFVDVAIDGAQAIKYIERRKYDLILMDLTISKIDGYKTTQMIRKNYGDKFISEVPIIGFSGRSDEKARDKCFRSGMNDFVSKPFKQDELLNKVAKQIVLNTDK